MRELRMKKTMFLVSVLSALASFSSQAAQEFKMKIECENRRNFGNICQENPGFLGGWIGVLGMSEEISDSLEQMSGTFDCKVKAAYVTSSEGNFWGIYKIYSCRKVYD